MDKFDWKKLNSQRLKGVVLIILGIFTLFTPFFIGEWIISLIGVVLMVVGVFTLFETIRQSNVSSSYLEYLTGLIVISLGAVLFFSPNFALTGLVFIVSILFLADGVSHIYYAFKNDPKTKSKRSWWNVFNGLVSIAIGFGIWFFITANLGVFAIGTVLGLKLLVEGWTRVLLPEKSLQAVDFVADMSVHPDYKLRLEPNEVVKQIQTESYEYHQQALYQNLSYCLPFLGIFFAIHVARTDSRFSLLGFITPFSALIGDILMSILIALIIVIPIRLIWRKLTRPFERVAWQRIIRLDEEHEQLTFFESSLKFWISQRLNFALQMREMRGSLNYASWRLIRFGIPLTAVFIAINSIWGFSWYFNSENWASAVWQEINKNRVDDWRFKMAEKVEANAISKGVAAENVFLVQPNGVNDADDFSFIVIGDTGEGDASQFALIEQIKKLGENDDIKFLVLSSDVIYPDGKMRVYEKNFYLPFKGFKKPIFAIPGNHDWFDANEGFNANFLDKDSANLSLMARLQLDLKTDEPLADKHFKEITSEAERLRQLYRIQNGFQRSSFFDLHTNGFSLIAIDTGILKSIDEKQKTWLKSALNRAKNNYKFIIIGHPIFAAGANQAVQTDSFNEIYQMLKAAQVDVIMGGDTHDFEYYRERYEADGQTKEIQHFVNGGGGAYLSIGTALDFPEIPPTADYGFYPRTDRLWEKLQKETPWWKSPAIGWIKYLNGFPLTTETLSGVFDMNNAPFFQSFMEIKVERSKNQVRMLLYGVDGQLRWKDIQTGGLTKPNDKSDDDFVEFITPL